MNNKFSNYIGMILILSDVFLLNLSLKLSYFFRNTFFKDILPTFDEFEIDKYFWILLLIIILLSFEKIYFIRFDFWTDTKKIFKVLFLSFIMVLQLFQLQKFQMNIQDYF